MSKRNTKAPRPRRNTRQLEMVPTSANMAARQSSNIRAVVSLRMRGDLIAAADKAAEGLRLSRSEFMLAAIVEAVKRGQDSGLARIGKAGKRRAR